MVRCIAWSEFDPWRLLTEALGFLWGLETTRFIEKVLKANWCRVARGLIGQALSSLAHFCAIGRVCTCCHGAFALISSFPL